MQCVVSGRSEYLDLLENIVPPSRTTLRRLPSKVDTIPNEDRKCFWSKCTAKNSFCKGGWLPILR